MLTKQKKQQASNTAPQTNAYKKCLLNLLGSVMSEKVEIESYFETPVKMFN